MKQVNIYVDKSAWNLNKTITCIIDMQVISSTETNQVTPKDGGIDFFTGLPSQFSALTDINTLVMESQKKSKSLQTTLSLLLHNIENCRKSKICYKGKNLFQ